MYAKSKANCADFNKKRVFEEKSRKLCLSRRFFA